MSKEMGEGCNLKGGFFKGLDTETLRLITGEEGADISVIPLKTEDKVRLISNASEEVLEQTRKILENNELNILSSLKAILEPDKYHSFVLSKIRGKKAINLNSDGELYQIELEDGIYNIQVLNSFNYSSLTDVERTLIGDIKKVISVMQYAGKTYIAYTEEIK